MIQARIPPPRRSVEAPPKKRRTPPSPTHSRLDHTASPTNPGSPLPVSLDSLTVQVTNITMPPIPTPGTKTAPISSVTEGTTDTCERTPPFHPIRRSLPSQSWPRLHHRPPYGVRLTHLRPRTYLQPRVPMAQETVYARRRPLLAPESLYENDCPFAREEKRELLIQSGPHCRGESVQATNSVTPNLTSSLRCSGDLMASFKPDMKKREPELDDLETTAALCAKGGSYYEGEAPIVRHRKYKRSKVSKMETPLICMERKGVLEEGRVSTTRLLSLPMTKAACDKVVIDLDALTYYPAEESRYDADKNPLGWSPFIKP